MCWKLPVIHQPTSSLLPGLRKELHLQVPHPQDQAGPHDKVLSRGHEWKLLELLVHQSPETAGSPLLCFHCSFSLEREPRTTSPPGMVGKHHPRTLGPEEQCGAEPLMNLDHSQHTTGEEGISICLFRAVDILPIPFVRGA